MTELRDKAIDIKGKAYVLVSDRIIYFNNTYPNGCIKTERISDVDMEIFKATVIPDMVNPERYFTGYSQAKWGEGLVNKTAALENAETSAVGRALAMMGIGVIDSVASADEMAKAGATEDKSEEKKKPRFNKEQLDSFTKKAGDYKDAEEALKEIRKYYNIGKEKEAEVRKLYESLKAINDNK